MIMYRSACLMFNITQSLLFLIVMTAINLTLVVTVCHNHPSHLNNVYHRTAPMPSHVNTICYRTTPMSTQLSPVNCVCCNSTCMPTQQCRVNTVCHSTKPMPNRPRQVNTVGFSTIPMQVMKRENGKELLVPTNHSILLSVFNTLDQFLFTFMDPWTH